MWQSCDVQPRMRLQEASKNKISLHNYRSSVLNPQDTHTFTSQISLHNHYPCSTEMHMCLLTLLQLTCCSVSGLFMMPSIRLTNLCRFFTCSSCYTDTPGRAGTDRGQGFQEACELPHHPRIFSLFLGSPPRVRPPFYHLLPGPCAPNHTCIHPLGSGIQS